MEKKTKINKNVKKYINFCEKNKKMAKYQKKKKN